MKIAFSLNAFFCKLKKSVNLLKKLPQICFILKIEVFNLKLFFDIFRRGKISQKIEMKRKWELQKKYIKTECNFHIFRCKVFKYFFIFLKFWLFWTKWSIYLWNLVGKSFRKTPLKITFKIVPFAFFLNGLCMFIQNLNEKMDKKKKKDQK